MTTHPHLAQFARKKPTTKAMATYFYLLGVLAAFAAAAVLVAAEAKALPTQKNDWQQPPAKQVASKKSL